MNPYAVAALNGAAPPVVPYTQRRLLWIQDWLEQRSPYRIDPTRVSVMGSSMGGAGSSMLARRYPERFAAASCFVPPIGFAENTGQGARLIGTSAQNLPSTEPAPGGGVLRMNDYWNFAARLSATERDPSFMRFYRGRSEFVSNPTVPEWSASTVVAAFSNLNATAWGAHLVWDQRDHSPSNWSTEDAGNPYPDVGQWISPVLTDRPSRTSLVRHRSNQSYPAFCNDDQNSALPGRQPTLGNGDPLDGDLWGTWGGYYDWDTATLTDTPSQWACTVFLTGLSAVSVDNYPGTSATCDVGVRKPQQFRPEPGTVLLWRHVRLGENAVLRSGTTVAAADGLVMVTNLTVSKDPQRTRLEIMAPPVLRLTSPSTFRAEGAPGLQCTLETSPSLSPANWSPALAFPIPSTGVVTGTLPGVAGEPQRFHRLRATLPSP
jgi:pimeloyl-ACP methyl ester carboxylesterase